MLFVAQNRMLSIRMNTCFWQRLILVQQARCTTQNMYTLYSLICVVIDSQDCARLPESQERKKSKKDEKTMSNICVALQRFKREGPLVRNVCTARGSYRSSSQASAYISGLIIPSMAEMSRNAQGNLSAYLRVIPFSLLTSNKRCWRF